MNDIAERVIEVKNLDISVKMVTGDIHAIRGVDFFLGRNEVLALVGESGCGKIKKPGVLRKEECSWFFVMDLLLDQGDPWVLLKRVLVRLIKMNT